MWRIAIEKVRTPIGHNLKAKVKKGSINKAILVRTKKAVRRKGGGFIVIIPHEYTLYIAQSRE